MLTTRALQGTFIVGIFFLLVILLISQCNKTKEVQRTVIAITSEQKQWIDKYGQEHTSRMIIEADRKTLRQLVNSKDSTIAELAKKLKSTRKASGAISTTTVTAETIEIPQDSIVLSKSPCDTLPTYNYKMMNRWVSMDVMASSTKAIVNYKVTNEYEHVIKKERGSLVVEVTNKNPNTTTQEIYAITVPVKKRQGLKAIALIAAFGAGAFVASQ